MSCVLVASTGAAVLRRQVRHAAAPLTALLAALLALSLVRQPCERGSSSATAGVDAGACRCSAPDGGARGERAGVWLCTAVMRPSRRVRASEAGRVAVTVTDARGHGEGDETVSVIVEDNGIGLPETDRDRLTEPYVTTRAKGTGLGLAIVRKIMEDHGGRLSIDDRRSADGRIIGAVATLELPLADPGAVPGAAASDNRHSTPRQDGPNSSSGSTRP